VFVAQFGRLSARWPRGARAACGVLVCVALSACGAATEDESWLYPLWVPTDVRVADIDGDGRADILTLAMVASSASQREGRLLVRRQTAPGVFAPAESYTVGIYPWQMALADVDGDGAPDLVLTDVGSPTGTTDRAIWLLRQSSGQRGQFEAPQRLSGNPNQPYGLAVGDLNGDGRPDIVVADSLAPARGATVLYQSASNAGSFLAPVALVLPGDASAVTVGDLDGDGRLDLAFRVTLDVNDLVPETALALVYQQPAGTLGPAQRLSPHSGLNTRLLVLTDVNGDGVRDVVTFFNPSSDNFGASLEALLQSSPPGSFTPIGSSLDGLRGLDGGAVADLNGDGLSDFAAVGFYPEGSPSTVLSNLHVLLQAGNGSFVLRSTTALPFSASRVAAGDLNGDGLLDLAVLGAGNQVLVLLQLATAPGSFGPPTLLN
jgi:hypothetical protein